MAKRTVDQNAPELPSPRRIAAPERTRAQSTLTGLVGGIPFANSPQNPLVTTGPISVSSSGQTPGFPRAPTGGFNVYRQIRDDPTISIARAVIFGPILASPWTYKKSADDAPDEWVDFIRENFTPIESQLKRQLLFALDFGCRSFEQIYRAFDFNGATRIGVRKFKPLRPENTEVLTDDRTGAYAGLRNGDVDLDPEETLHFAYDAEDDDWYGRSRFESVREDAWWPWKCQLQTLAKLGRKVSNIIPVVEGPLGVRGFDADGKEVTGYDQAVTLIDSLSRGEGIAVEKLIGDINDLMSNPELSKLTRWSLNSFDTGSSSTAVSGILESLRYLDQLKMRGMLRPERTATEGQHGTLAEVTEQADVGLAEGEDIHKSMTTIVNWHSVDRLLAWNFGEQARGKVVIVPTPLIDERRAIFKTLLSALLVNPGVADLLVSKIDIDAVAEHLGLPTTGPINPELGELPPIEPAPASSVVPGRQPPPAVAPAA